MGRCDSQPGLRGRGRPEKLQQGEQTSVAWRAKKRAVRRANCRRWSRSSCMRRTSLAQLLSLVAREATARTRLT